MPCFTICRTKSTIGISHSATKLLAIWKVFDANCGIPSAESKLYGCPYIRWHSCSRSNGSTKETTDNTRMNAPVFQSCPRLALCKVDRSPRHEQTPATCHPAQQACFEAWGSLGLGDIVTGRVDSIQSQNWIWSHATKEICWYKILMSMVEDAQMLLPLPDGNEIYRKIAKTDHPNRMQDGV